MLYKHPVVSYKHLVIVVILLFIVMNITPSIAVDTVNIEHANGKSPGDDIDWWPMFHHDLQHSGYSTSNAPDTNNVLWSYKIGGIVWSSPAVVDGRVYIGSDYGNVYCLDANTGGYIWSYDTRQGVFYSSPAVADGKVYIGTRTSPYAYDGNVYCLDADTGDYIWSWQTGDRVHSSPAVADGRVYIGTYNGYVYCLDATTGDCIWYYKTGERVSSSPAVADGKVYIGSLDNNVYCLDASTGDYIWNYTTGNDVYSSPAVADGKVYIGSDDGTIYAFGELDPDAPSAPEINGPTKGVPDVLYNFTFKSESPLGDDLYYWIEWADGSNSGWLGPTKSSVEITESHVWDAKGVYPIQAKAIDTNGSVSSWGILMVSIPRNKAIVNSLFQWFLERFTILSRLLYLIK